jgi:hypothetical protein
LDIGGTSKLSDLFVMGQSKRLLDKIKMKMKKHIWKHPGK